MPETSLGAPIHVLDGAVIPEQKNHLRHGVKQGLPVGAEAMDLFLYIGNVKMCIRHVVAIGE